MISQFRTTLFLAAGLALVALPQAASVAAPSSKYIEPVYGKPGWQDDFIARSIVRAGLLDLRLRPAATSDDYRILIDTLGIAQGLNPNDTDIVRRIIEAANNAHDEGMVETATRRLVQLDPTDTVAQLRLISARIGKIQTAEERLKAYKGIVGDGGAGLDSSIRSRIALDAALLARETGDDAGFAEFLKAALRFDSTNKEAALVALSFYCDRVNDAPGRVQMISNLLLSDPLDPNVHRQMSQELAAGGAYAQARRFHEMSKVLYTLGGVRPDDHFAVEERVQAWAVDGSAAVVESLQKMLITERYNAQLADDRAKKELRESTTKAEDVRLNPAIERIRILAADVTQDQKVLEDCRVTLESGCVSLRHALEEIAKIKDQTTPEDVIRLRLASAAGMGEIQLLRLWANMDIDKVPADLAKAKEIAGDLQRLSIIDAVEAWQLLRAGKNEEALAAFDALADAQFEYLGDRDISELEPQKIGKAMTLEALMRPSEAAAIYREVARERAGDAAGIWCKLRMERMGVTDTDREALAKRLSAIAETVPHLVEDLVSDPASTMSLSADVPQTFASTFDRNDLVIKLRNKTKIPLGLGTDRAINSRLLAQPAIDIQIKSQISGAQPEVVDIDRKLRLNPGETLEVRVRADAGYTGWLLENGAGKVVRSRYRVMQGFTPAQDGTMRVGPGCVTADSPQVVRNPLKEALLQAQEYVDQIRVASGDNAMSLIIAIRARLMVDDTFGSPERASIAQAMAAKYPTFDVKLRMLTLVEMPNAAMFEEFKAFDDVAKTEAAPGAAALAVITRISDPADPALAAAMNSADAVTKEVATLHKARLSDPEAIVLARAGFRVPIDSVAAQNAPVTSNAGPAATSNNSNLTAPKTPDPKDPKAPKAPSK